MTSRIATVDYDMRPCPFCGGEPMDYNIEPHTHVIATLMPDHPGSWWIECPKCDIHMGGDTREEVVAAWNKLEAT